MCERTNPYSKVTFRLPLTIKAGSLDHLRPSQDHGNTDGPVIQSIIDAFERYSPTYTIEAATIRGGPGDFHFYHSASGVRATGELKRGQVTHTDDDSLSLMSGRSKHGKYQPIFTPLASWDWLLSTSRHGNMWVFLSKDQLPAEWFRPQEEPTELKWECGRSIRSTHTWCGNVGKQFVLWLESILDQRLGNEGLVAQNDRFSEAATWSPARLLEEEQESSEEAGEEGRKSGKSRAKKPKPLPGTGRMYSLSTFQAMHAEILSKRCESE